MIIELPISIGEAIDKLTILDIKSQKIKDDRINDIKKEYNSIYSKLKIFIDKYSELYNSMKKINLIIWEQMDLLRDGNIDDLEFMNLSRECIKSNDIRFRIKKKINLISNSTLKEQKSYKINSLVIEINCSDITLLLNPIKYFSYVYDEIIINSNHVDELKKFFFYDTTIKYNQLNNKYTKKITFTKKKYELNEIYEIMNINEEIINKYL